MERLATLNDMLSVFVAVSLFIFVSKNASVRIFGGRFFVPMAAEFMFVFFCCAVAARLCMPFAGRPPLEWLSWRTAMLPKEFLAAVSLNPVVSIALAVLFVAASRKAAHGIFPRLSARFSLILIGAFLLSANRNGLPSGFAKAPEHPAAGIERIFDSSKVKGSPDIKDIALDKSGSTIYAAAGKSGIIRINAKSLKASMLDVNNSEIGKISMERNSGTIYALDTSRMGLQVIDPSGTRLLSMMTVRTTWGDKAVSLYPVNNTVYVSYSWRPGAALFNTSIQRQDAGINFLSPKTVEFRTGGQAMAYDPISESIIILAGPSGKEGGTLIYRIDPVRFRISAMGYIPAAAASLTGDASNRTAYAGSLFTPEIYEIDLSNLKITHRYAAPYASKSIVRIPGKNILIAAGGYDGKLVAIDTNTGLAMRTVFLRRPAVAAVISPDGNTVFIACGKAIYRIDTEKWLPSHK